MSESQELLGGRYRILGRLGKGAMGVVFMAHDPVLDRKVAIKQMTAEIARNEDLRQRFYVEARAAARLNHPHIITIHELQESGGEIYMVMELLEGKSLASVMEERHGPLPTEMTLDVVAQVCDGLEYAHQHAIVHRDIKPANIFVAGTGVVKILDFGIARLGSLHMTATGALVGTPDYMSPEQVRGDEIDRRTDLWAVGAVLYQMLSGAKPFEGKPLAKLLMAITQTPHVPLQQRSPAVPRTVCDLVDRLLAKPRDARPATAALVRDELRAILGRDTIVRPAVQVAEEYGETLVSVPGTRGGVAPGEGAAAAAAGPAAVPLPVVAAPPAATLIQPVPTPPASDVPTPLPPPLPSVPAAPAADQRPEAAPPQRKPVASPPPAPPVPPVAVAEEKAASKVQMGASPVSPATPAPRRGGRLGLVLALVAVLIVLGGAAMAGIAWWLMGPRLLELAGLRSPAADSRSDTAQAQTGDPAARPDAPGPSSEPSSPSAQEGPAPPAVEPVEEEPGPVFVPQPPAAAEGAPPPTSAPTRAVEPPRAVEAPRATSAPANTAPQRVEARPTEREAPSAVEPPRSRSAPSADPQRSEPAAPAERGDEPAVTAPRVTDRLTQDTVATLSGQRSQSTYGGADTASAVAAANRITWVLQQYAGALQRRDAAALKRHRPSPGAAEMQLLSARELTVRLENLEIKVNGASAVARCRRIVEGTAASGSPLRESRTVTFALVRQPTGWVITEAH